VSRNAEVRRILESREIAEQQRRQQREIVAARTKPQVLEYGYVRNAVFPKKLFK
jgi:hypothetical protein